MREFRTSGSVRDGDGNVPIYSATWGLRELKAVAAIAQSVGDLPKWRANWETCWIYGSRVRGERFLICMSSIMRWRRGVMAGSFAGWNAL